MPLQQPDEYELRMLIKLRKRVQRVLSARACYLGAWSWILHIVDRLFFKAKQSIGWLGRFQGFPVVEVKVVGSDRPIALRLGTTDWLVMREIFIAQEYESTVRAVPAARYILDLGANIGLSIMFWEQKYPGVKVLGVEADLQNATLAARNIGDNSEILCACATDGSRRMSIDRSSGAEWSYRAKPCSQEGDDAVEGFGVESLIGMLVPDGEKLDLIKIDIEGGEKELFGNPAWLARVENLVVEVHEPYMSVERLCESLRQVQWLDEDSLIVEIKGSEVALVYAKCK